MTQVHHFLLAMGANNTAPRMFELDLSEATHYELGAGEPRSNGMNRRSWDKIAPLFKSSQRVSIDALIEAVKEHEHPGGGKNFILNHCVRLGWLVPVDAKTVTLHVCGDGERINAESSFSAETLCIFRHEDSLYAIQQGKFLDYKNAAGQPIRLTASWLATGKYNGQPTLRMIKELAHKLCDLKVLDEAKEKLLHIG